MDLALHPHKLYFPTDLSSHPASNPEPDPGSHRRRRRLGLYVAAGALLMMVAGGLSSDQNESPPDSNPVPNVTKGGCDGGGQAAGLGCGAGAVGAGGASKACLSGGSKAAFSGGSKLALSGGSKALGVGATKLGASVLGKSAASGLLAVEVGGARAFASVGTQALEEGVSLVGMRGLSRQYPQIIGHTTDTRWLSQFARGNPEFATDVGKELYFTRAKDWAAYGGQRSLIGFGSRHSLTFAHYARTEAGERFSHALGNLTQDLAQNGIEWVIDKASRGELNDGDDDGVELALENRMLRMRITTPETTYSTAPIPLRFIASTNEYGTDPDTLIKLEESSNTTAAPTSVEAPKH